MNSMLYQSKMSGRRFMSSCSDAFGFCNNTMIIKAPTSSSLNGSKTTKIKVFVWPGQRKSSYIQSSQKCG